MSPLLVRVAGISLLVATIGHYTPITSSFCLMLSFFFSIFSFSLTILPLSYDSPSINSPIVEQIPVATENLPSPATDDVAVRGKIPESY